MQIPQARAFVRFYEIMDEAYRLRADSMRDWNVFVRNSNEFIILNYYMINHFEINTWCWNIYISYTKGKDISMETLGKICQWMKLVTEIDKQYEFEDTYAHLLFSLGNNEKAAEVEETALSHAIQDKADNETIKSYTRKARNFKDGKMP